MGISLFEREDALKPSHNGKSNGINILKKSGKGGIGKRTAIPIISVLAGVLLLAIACGGQDAPTPRPPAPATSEDVVTPAKPKPEVFFEPETIGGVAVDADNLAFRYPNLNQITDCGSLKNPDQGVGMCVRGGTEIIFAFNNISDVHQHNWVLVKDGTKDIVAARGAAAGASNDWVQPGDPNVIVQTRMLNPGEKEEIRFPAPPAGEYQFVCTFPGHSDTMFGDLGVTAD